MSTKKFKVRKILIHKKYILIYTLIVFLLQIDAFAREEHDWTYNLERGKTQYNAQMYTDAEDNLKMALKKNNKCFEAANILANIFLNKNDIFSAEEYFLISLEIDDNQPDIHIAIGEIDEFFLRNDSAISRYQKSLSMNSNNPKALIALARVLYRQGKNTEAENYFNLCYNAGIGESENIYKNAEIIRREDPLKASIEFKKAIEKNPAHIAAYIGLADSYRQLKLYDDAAAILETLKKNKPDDPRPYIYLGSIYFNNKPDTKRRKYFINLSIANYEKAIKLDPENADLYFHLANIYKQTKNMERANELLEIAENLLKK